MLVAYLGGLTSKVIPVMQKYLTLTIELGQKQNHDDPVEEAKQLLAATQVK